MARSRYLIVICGALLWNSCGDSRAIMAPSSTSPKGAGAATVDAFVASISAPSAGGNGGGAVKIFDNGSFSGNQQGTANVATTSQRLFEDFVVSRKKGTITGISWQQHDHRLATYLNTEVLIFAGLPYANSPVYSANIVATRQPNATGSLFVDWDGYDYQIGGLSIDLQAGTYWIGLNTNYTGTAGSSWDNTSGAPDTIPGFRLINANFPAPGLQVAHELAFVLRGHL